MTGVPLSLTGPDSHRLVRKPGVGSLSLGPAGAIPAPDLVVDPARPIDWTVFDEFTVPAGHPWPRVFRYAGDDTGFFGWAARRPVETFSWQPRDAHHLDVTSARIGTLGVTLRQAPVHLVLAGTRHLSVAGDLGLLTAALGDDAGCPSLSFLPDTTAARDTGPVGVPPLPAFAAARSVDVKVPPLRQPFDCASLLQFPDLRHLSLAGSLTGLPGLGTWPDLAQVIAFNVEQAAGKRLRATGRASVSQLRKPAWFATEYGLPFSAWPSRQARAATGAYRTAADRIATATGRGDVERAVRVFVAVINALPDVETTEREDTAEAVAQLTVATPLGDLRQAASRWLDDERDF